MDTLGNELRGLACPRALAALVFAQVADADHDLLRLRRKVWSDWRSLVVFVGPHGWARLDFGAFPANAADYVGRRDSEMAGLTDEVFELCADHESFRMCAIREKAAKQLPSRFLSLTLSRGSAVRAEENTRVSTAGCVTECAKPHTVRPGHAMLCGLSQKLARGEMQNPFAGCMVDVVGPVASLRPRSSRRLPFAVVDVKPSQLHLLVQFSIAQGVVLVLPDENAETSLLIEGACWLRNRLERLLCPVCGGTERVQCEACDESGQQTDASCRGWDSDMGGSGQ